MRKFLLPTASFLIAVSACASPEVSSEPDAGMVASDATTEDDPDEDEPGCADGTHTCGSTCVADVVNDPSVGCRYGCGEACPTDPNGVSSCTSEGTCDVDCKAGYVKFNGTCTAASCVTLNYACGDLVDDNGTTLYSCGTCFGSSMCGADHLCDISADASEPNNTRTAAKDLGTFNDADDREHHVTDLTIHTQADEDWFRFRVADGFDANNPDARVTLSLPGTFGWLHSPYELTVWFKCDGSDLGTNVKCGEWGTLYATNNATSSTLGQGCTIHMQYVVWAKFEPNCSGTKDEGTAYVRVRKRLPARGDPFDLGVVVK